MRAENGLNVEPICHCGTENGAGKIRGPVGGDPNALRFGRRRGVPRPAAKLTFTGDIACRR